MLVKLLIHFFFSGFILGDPVHACMRTASRNKLISSSWVRESGGRANPSSYNSKKQFWSENTRKKQYKRLYFFFFESSNQNEATYFSPPFLSSKFYKNDLSTKTNKSLCFVFCSKWNIKNNSLSPLILDKHLFTLSEK